MRIRVTPDDIVVGRPITRNIYDANGNLLLKFGHVLTTDLQIETLINRGAYINADSRDPNPSVCVPVTSIKESLQNFPIIPNSRPCLALIEHVYAELGQVYGRVYSGNKFQSIMIELSEAIQQACEQDKNAALSTILLPYDVRYSIKHHADTAIACEIVLKRLGYTP